MKIFARYCWLLMVILSVYYAKSYDFMGKEYESDGLPLIGFHISRLIIFIGIANFIYSIGSILAIRIKRFSRFRLKSVEKHILYCWIGVSVLTIFAFPVGLLGLYKAGFIIGILLIFMISQIVYKKNSLSMIIFRYWKFLTLTKKINGKQIIIVLITGLIFTTIYILRVNRPFVSANDAYEHYVPYQLEVVRTGSTLPNDIWYQFYQSQGLGLTHFTNQLVGILGSQTASFFMLVLGVITWWRYLLWVGFSSTLAWIGTVVLGYVFAVQHYGVYISYNTHHTQLAMWIIGFLWFFSKWIYAKKLESRVYESLILLMGISFILFLPIGMALLLPFLIWSFLIFVLEKKGDNLVPLVKISIAFIFVLMSVLCLNYLLTGMPFDNPKNTLWKIADQVRFSKWADPYLVVYFIVGMGKGHSSLNFPNPLHTGIFEWLCVFRYFILRPILAPKFSLIIGGFILLMVNFIRNKESVDLNLKKIALFGFLVCYCVFIYPILGTPSSIFRNYSFLSVTLIIIPLCAWTGYESYIKKSRFKEYFSNLLIAGFLALMILHFKSTSITGFIGSSVDYAFGTIDTRQVIRQYPGLSASDNALVKLKIKTPILSLTRDNHSFGSLLFPSPGMKIEPSRFSGEGRWAQMAYGDEVLARKELMKYGVEYFWIDFNCVVSVSGIPFGELFGEEAIRRNFEIIWQEKDVAILGWKKGMGEEITQEWARRWVELRDRNPDRIAIISRIVDQRMREIYHYNLGQVPVRIPAGLPEIEGFEAPK